MLGCDLPDEKKLAAAAQFQIDSIMEELEKRNISLPIEDVLSRLIIWMHSRAVTERVVNQIVLFPKPYSSMSVKEKCQAAGWRKLSVDQGTKETSRAVLKKLER